MLASSPASTVNQKRPDLGIPNRFDFTSSRSSSLVEHDLFGKPVSTFPDHALVLTKRQRDVWPIDDVGTDAASSHALRHV